MRIPMFDSLFGVACLFVSFFLSFLWPWQ
jgi:hypothetical protein